MTGMKATHFHDEDRDFWFVDGDDPEAADTQHWALMPMDAVQRSERTSGDLSAALALLAKVEQIVTYAQSTHEARDPKTNELMQEPIEAPALFEQIAPILTDLGTLRSKMS